jgi:hypothetical protein
MFRIGNPRFLGDNCFALLPLHLLVQDCGVLFLGISRCSEMLTAGYFANHSLVVHSQLPD